MHCGFLLVLQEDVRGVSFGASEAPRRQCFTDVQLIVVAS